MNITYTPILPPPYLPDLSEHSVDTIIALVSNQHLSQIVKLNYPIIDDSNRSQTIMKQFRRIIPFKLINSLISNDAEVNCEEELSKAISIQSPPPHSLLHLVSMIRDQTLPPHHDFCKEFGGNYMINETNTSMISQQIISLVRINDQDGFSNTTPNADNSISLATKVSEIPSISTNSANNVDITTLDPNQYSFVIIGPQSYFFSTPQSFKQLSELPIIASITFSFPSVDLSDCSDEYKYWFHSEIWPLTQNPKPIDKSIPPPAIFSKIELFTQKYLLSSLLGEILIYLNLNNACKLKYQDMVEESGVDNDDVKGYVEVIQTLKEIDTPHFGLVFDTPSFLSDIAQQFSLPTSTEHNEISGKQSTQRKKTPMKPPNPLDHPQLVIDLIQKHIIAFAADNLECDGMYHNDDNEDISDYHINSAQPHQVKKSLQTQFSRLSEDIQSEALDQLPVVLQHTTMQLVQQASAVVSQITDKLDISHIEIQESTATNDHSSSTIIPVSHHISNPSLQYLCNGFDLFLTHEPCNMCAMGAVHSRFERIFYLNQVLNGALSTDFSLHQLPGINHRYKVFKVDLDAE